MPFLAAMKFSVLSVIGKRWVHQFRGVAVLVPVAYGGGREERSPTFLDLDAEGIRKHHGIRLLHLQVRAVARGALLYLHRDFGVLLEAGVDVPSVAELDGVRLRG